MSASAIIPEPVDVGQVVASYKAEQLREHVLQQAMRDVEALRTYEPMPLQRDFHECRARERIIRGSNRSGKTTAALIECARAVTNQDPYYKYPSSGKAIIVGKDQTHIAGVLYNKLFRSDAFRVILDKDTQKWRAYREYDSDDRARIKETQMSGPLIPSRFIKKIAWANKAEGVPKVVYLKTGWEIWFFTGEGDPPNGIAADLALFDEEIPNSRWYEEVAARLGDRHGLFIWSATPQNSTLELYTLHKRAFEERYLDEPSVVEFYVTMAANMHFPQEERALLEKKYANNPEAYKIRILGEFNVTSFLVYPTFARALHGFRLFHPDRPEAGGVEITKEWNRFMIVDPGRVVCAVAFFAVPPPDHPLAEQRFLYDELYIRNCNAEIFADAVYNKVSGHRFQSFLIDPSSARQDTIGGGPSVYAQYSAALAKRRIECVNSGSNFTFACNDQKAGIMKFESWLHVGSEFNRPKFQYCEDTCPNFVWEIEQYRRKKDGDVITDKPIDRDDHMCLVAGTKVLCRRGSVAIEDVTTDDHVWTRMGWKPVAWSGPTRFSKTTKVTLSNYGTLEGTADHRVWVRGCGWVQLGDLRPGDSLEVPSCHEKIFCQQQCESYSGGFRTEDTQNQSGENCEFTSSLPVVADCTAQFGSTTEVRSQGDIAFTTRTTTRSTTALEISNASLTQGTHPSTRLSDGRQSDDVLRQNYSSSKTLLEKCTHGGKPAPVGLRHRVLLRRQQRLARQRTAYANTADRTTKQDHFPHNSAFVLADAEHMHAETAALMTSKRSADFAVLPSQQINTPVTNTAVHVVSVQSGLQEKQTYDLTVADAHEFYANGVLTHNCDAVRYMAMHDPSWVPQPKSVVRRAPAYDFFLQLTKEKDEQVFGQNSVNLGPGPSRN